MVSAVVSSSDPSSHGGRAAGPGQGLTSVRGTLPILLSLFFVKVKGPVLVSFRLLRHKPQIQSCAQSGLWWLIVLGAGRCEYWMPASSEDLLAVSWPDRRRPVGRLSFFKKRKTKLPIPPQGPPSRFHPILIPSSPKVLPPKASPGEFGGHIQAGPQTPQECFQLHFLV